MFDGIFEELSQLSGTALWLYIGSLVCGALQFVLSFIMGQMKTIQGIMAFKIAANTAMCLTGLLRGPEGYTSAAIGFLATVLCVAVYVIRKKGSEPKLWFLVGAAVVYVGFLIFTYREPKDLIAIFCALMFVVALGIRDPFKYRLLYLAVCLIWLPYDFAAALFTQLLSHFSTGVSYFIGIFRHDLPERRRKAQHDARQA